MKSVPTPLAFRRGAGGEVGFFYDGLQCGGGGLLQYPKGICLACPIQYIPFIGKIDVIAKSGLQLFPIKLILSKNLRKTPFNFCSLACLISIDSPSIYSPHLIRTHRGQCPSNSCSFIPHSRLFNRKEDCFITPHPALSSVLRNRPTGEDGRKERKSKQKC